MSVRFVTGKLGSGKTTVAVKWIVEALRDGKRVATNLDLNLVEALGPHNKDCVVYRLPDKPTRKHLTDIGVGYDTSEGYDEEKFGLVVLDEAGTWLNSRAWNDKERGPVIDWFIHARKKGWDVVFIGQDEGALDKQLVASLLEYWCECYRLDRIPIPFLASFCRMLGFDPVTFFRLHVCREFYPGKGGHKTRSYKYRGTDVFGVFDTMQVFSDGVVYFENGPVDLRAVYQLLPPYYTHGRYLESEVKHAPLELVGKALLFAVGYILGGAAGLGPAAALRRLGIARQRPIPLTSSGPYYETDNWRVLASRDGM